MINDHTICYFCNNKMDSQYQSHHSINCTNYDCKICGNYSIEWVANKEFNKDIYASYLFHINHIISHKTKGNTYCYIGTRENFDKINKEYSSMNAFLATYNEIENWYPLSLSDKIDFILLTLSQLSDYPGKNILLDEQSIFSLFFIKRYDKNNEYSKDIISEQLLFLMSYMSKQELIKRSNFIFKILPEGWKRIDELQKYKKNCKQAFVAMQFSENTKNLREALRKGIESAGYVARFIDEKHHNGQIVPEILYDIRQSKFVVADFSDSNNGAYYEAGYAAGLGKEVIHVCKAEIFKEEGHFDIKQKYTILWNDLDKLSIDLEKHIKATIN